MKLIKLSLACALLVLLSACSSKLVEWNGEYEYYHLTMAGDETNLYETAGTVDYIFIGTVDKVLRNVVDYNSSKKWDDCSSYAVTVQENLKGELSEKVECYRHGGYLKDGTLLYPRSDKLEDKNPLPQEGKQYIFMAFAQHGGELLLTEFHGDVEYTGAEQRAQYLDYIENSVEDNRERFISKYDLSAEN